MYRSAAVENGKARPSFFSKSTALLSVLRAVEAVQRGAAEHGGARRPAITFLNDGPIDGDLVELMRAHGEVVAITGGSNRASLRTAVAREAARTDSRADDLVWFAEDDYLYTPGAFTELCAAAAAFPDADYFALYGSDALDVQASSGRRARIRPRPGAELDPEALRVGQATWYRAHSTTSTFGVRRAALREDAALLRAVPWTGGAWDRATSLSLQGYRPFEGPDLLGDDAPPGPEGSRSARLPLGPRVLLRAAVRVAATVLTRRPAARRRVMLGSDPELVRHMELLEGTRHLEPTAATALLDWDAVARDTLSWAADAGLVAPAPGTRAQA